MKELLLSFFEDDKYAGWRNIAEALIEKGECIVPGTECLYRGGIGNFIIVVADDELIGCCKYTFDLEYFKTSTWFKDELSYFLAEKVKERERIQKQLDEIDVTIKELKDE